MRELNEGRIQNRNVNDNLRFKAIEIALSFQILPIEVKLGTGARGTIGSL